MDDSESDFICRKRLKLSDDDSRDMTYASASAVINKLSSIKQSMKSGQDKLAELFRKDLISAMKLADSENLRDDEYYRISDPWRQDWEKGVQVPINPNTIKPSNIIIKKVNIDMYGPFPFKLPKKYLHAIQDGEYKTGTHELHEMYKLSEQVCRYDLDQLDTDWLQLFNQLRCNCGEEEVVGWDMERVIEMLEGQCYEGMQQAMKTVEGLGIEYDEDAICDVCRDPEVEEGNEMIFCDGCDVSVHQACYGIDSIPSGSWMCTACAAHVKPPCIFCPITGGAMKPTDDGESWSHLSCALWIPEVMLGCSTTMEPVCHVDKIPATRWALVCSICRERGGACIQCSVQKCKTAFHVTCAYQENYEMRQVIDAEDNEGVQMKAFCRVHSHKSRDSPRKTSTSTPKKVSDMTDEEKSEERSKRLYRLSEEFYQYVDVCEISRALDIEQFVVDMIKSYWILKRKCNHNKALLTPKMEEGDILSRQREDSLIARLKMFIHLRQDLERVRNLCYMVTKREKLRLSLHQIKRDLFFHQSSMLRSKPDPTEIDTIMTAHLQRQSLYDKPDHVLQHAALLMAAEKEEQDEEAKLNSNKSQHTATGLKKRSLGVTPTSARDKLCVTAGAADKSGKKGESSTVKKSSLGLGKTTPSSAQGKTAHVSGKATPASGKVTPVSGKVTPASNKAVAVSGKDESGKIRKYVRRASPDGNPYIRPTYSSFSWMLSAKRRARDESSGTRTPESTGVRESRRSRRSLPVYQSAGMGLGARMGVGSETLDRLNSSVTNDRVMGSDSGFESDRGNKSRQSSEEVNRAVETSTVRNTTPSKSGGEGMTGSGRKHQSSPANRPESKKNSVNSPSRIPVNKIINDTRASPGSRVVRSGLIDVVSCESSEASYSTDENREMNDKSRSSSVKHNGLISHVHNKNSLSSSATVKRLKESQNLNSGKTRQNGSLNGLQKTLDGFVVIKDKCTNSLDETSDVDVISIDDTVRIRKDLVSERGNGLIRPSGKSLIGLKTSPTSCRLAGQQDLRTRSLGCEVTLNDIGRSVSRPSTPSNDSVVLEEVTRSGQTKRTSKWQMSLSALIDDQPLDVLDDGSHSGGPASGQPLVSNAKRSLDNSFNKSRDTAAAALRSRSMLNDDVISVSSSISTDSDSDTQSVSTNRNGSVRKTRQSDVVINGRLTRSQEQNKKSNTRRTTLS